MKLTPPEWFALQRIRLRQATVEDAEAIFAYGSDPTVARYADWPIHTSIEPLVASIKDRAELWKAGSAFSWIIATLVNDRAIGGVSCRLEKEESEIGFLLHKDYWGKGYAAEAAAPVIEWLFSQSSMLKVSATCDIENTASMRVLEKLGFVRQRLLEKAVIRPQISDDPRDAYLYARMKRPTHNRVGGGF